MLLKMTTYIHQDPMLRMRGVVPPFLILFNDLMFNSRDKYEHLLLLIPDINV